MSCYYRLFEGLTDGFVELVGAWLDFGKAVEECVSEDVERELRDQVRSLEEVELWERERADRKDVEIWELRGKLDEQAIEKEGLRDRLRHAVWSVKNEAEKGAESYRAESMVKEELQEVLQEVGVLKGSLEVSEKARKEQESERNRDASKRSKRTAARLKEMKEELVAQRDLERDQHRQELVEVEARLDRVASEAESLVESLRVVKGEQEKEISSLRWTLDRKDEESRGLEEELRLGEEMLDDMAAELRRAGRYRRGEVVWVGSRWYKFK